jgi:hypothetical protein
MRATRDWETLEAILKRPAETPPSTTSSPAMATLLDDFPDVWLWLFLGTSGTTALFLALRIAHVMHLLLRLYLQSKTLSDK